MGFIFVQETNQGTVTKFTELLAPQLNLSIEIIKKASPRMIVVNNAFASKKVYNTVIKESKLDEKIGTYRFPVDDKISIPIFFCSMLSGQRALDTHSKERLIWHINFVNQNL